MAGESEAKGFNNLLDAYIESKNDYEATAKELDNRIEIEQKKLKETKIIEEQIKHLQKNLENNNLTISLLQGQLEAIVQKINAMECEIIEQQAKTRESEREESTENLISTKKALQAKLDKQIEDLSLKKDTLNNERILKMRNYQSQSDKIQTHIIFIVDHSKYMTDKPITFLKKTISPYERVIESLQEFWKTKQSSTDEKISIITFSRQAKLILDCSGFSSDFDHIKSAMKKGRSENANVEAAMNMALQ